MSCLGIETATRRLVQATVVLLLVAGHLPARAADDAALRNQFEAKIRPVLLEKCVQCHSLESGKSKGGLRVDDRKSLILGGDSGPAVVPGDPDASLILQALRGNGLRKMPPDAPLPESTIEDFRSWIATGAFDPREAAEARPTRTSGPWWSLQPVTRPVVPALPQVQTNPRSSIDAFLLARLQQAGLQTNPEADRITLIRRLSFDLLGLPPTPEEIESFVQDDRPTAYERLVDRLLASPHFGERSARLWMDLVHFAETHGHDQDRIRPNAWPYRDYLIRTFNADLPYAQFIQQQIAADTLAQNDPGAIEALGFLASGPWDESSLRDIREDTLDREIGRYLDRDDMIATSMSTVVSTPVHCARCHDHKFDPVSQADYYGLQAVFAGVDRADRAYDKDPANALRRKELSSQIQAIEHADSTRVSTLVDDRTKQHVEDWLMALKGRAEAWAILKPESVTSAAQTHYELQADGSYLATGNRPAKELTTLVASSPLALVSAVRLEVIPDDRLPGKGPGRNENGNLHLTEIRLFLVPAEPNAAPIPLAISRAIADFQQEGWGVAAAIDGNLQTAWGIYPAVGRPHEAVFELAADAPFPPGAHLKVELEQVFPENHPIGRFRLSLTGAARPVNLAMLPPELDSAVRVPAQERTERHLKTLVLTYLREQLSALPAPNFVFAAAADFAPDGSHRPSGKPRPIRVLNRGDIKQPGAPARPGALQCVADLPGAFAQAEADAEKESPRRAALAVWISDPRNPLTWRSIVNRAWQQHFGKGLVDTPSDFGRMGSLPTHAELLDWLTATFRDDDQGSLKQLRRRLVTSAAYRQSSASHSQAHTLDQDNRLLWRSNRRRLDAESLRDAVLLASGALDQRMGGPSVQQFKLSPGVHVTPVVEYPPYDWSSPGSARRSVYRFLFRTLPDPFMEVLDAADGSQLTETRGESVSPLQALTLLHNPFMLQFSQRMATDLQQHSSDPGEQISLAFQRLFGRRPDAVEQGQWREVAGQYGLASACLALFNTNEFLFLD